MEAPQPEFSNAITTSRRAPRTSEVARASANAAFIVRQMRTLAEAGWGSKRIARELGVARNTVRRYLRGGEAADEQ